MWMLFTPNDFSSYRIQYAMQATANNNETSTLYSTFHGEPKYELKKKTADFYPMIAVILSRFNTL